MLYSKIIAVTLCRTVVSWLMDVTVKFVIKKEKFLIDHIISI